jgi:hypothetical protein
LTKKKFIFFRVYTVRLKVKARAARALVLRAERKKIWSGTPPKGIDTIDGIDTAYRLELKELKYGERPFSPDAAGGRGATLP